VEKNRKSVAFTALIYIYIKKLLYSLHININKNFYKKQQINNIITFKILINIII